MAGDYGLVVVVVARLVVVVGARVVVVAAYAGGRPWQVPVPESVNVRPGIGRNLHS